MKSRSLAIFILIISLAVVPSLQLAVGASSSSSTSTSTSKTTTTIPTPTTPFSERLDIYTAGTNDLWRISLNPVNDTRPDIVSAEGVAGVNAYELTVIEGSTASGTSAIFWNQGYGLIKLPFIPYSGAFLNVTATSQSAARSAASDFSAYLGANFTQVSSGGGNYTFYTPAAFNLAGASVFDSTVPTKLAGLASLIPESALAGDPSPMVVLTGVRSSSSFTHTVAFGATEGGAVGSNESLLLEDAVAIANDSFVASPNATSTQVVVHSLDGLVHTTDNATVTNDLATYSGTYSYTVSPGTRFRPNMTIFSNPPTLVVTRTVTSGSLSNGGVVSVTLHVMNTADNGTAQNVTMSDNWWTSYPSIFSLSAGNSSFTIPTLSPQQNVSRAYSLKVITSSSENLVVPPAGAAYSYEFGGKFYNQSTTTNELELRVNDPGPALNVRAISTDASGAAFGKAGNFTALVTNSGDAPALNLHILGFTNPTLSPGSEWRVNESLPLTNLADRNFTNSFNLGWTAPDGTTGTLASNPSTVILTHSSAQLPSVQFKWSLAVTAQALAAGSINASYTMENKGSAAASTVNVTQSFPSGVACEAVVSGNATCASGVVSLSASSFATLVNDTGTVTLTFPKENFIAPSASVTTTYEGLTLATSGQAVPLAAGVATTKTFVPNAVFTDQESNVTVRITNQGTLPVYNVTLAAAGDSFDSTVSGSFNGQYLTLNSGQSQSLNYTVKMTAAGNHTGSATSLSYIFGGYEQQYQVNSTRVLVFKPILASTSTSSTPPKEGVDFPLVVTVQNQSPVNVTDVYVTVPIPVGLSIVNYSSSFHVSGRTVTLSLPELKAGSTSNNQVTLKAAFDGSFTLGTSTLTFQYLGTTITGPVSTPAVLVGVNALLRYELPIGAAVVIVLLVAVYMHRKLATPPAK